MHYYADDVSVSRFQMKCRGGRGESRDPSKIWAIVLGQVWNNHGITRGPVRFEHMRLHENQFYDSRNKALSV